ncbi:MAG: lysophospholipid acyltransferase family protein [Candidatus Kuenenia sp.]|nr:lysophospholipid acyltransferase family protein [Candidatus Kuenenia hertensis]
MKKLKFYITGILGCLLIRVLLFTLRIDHEPKGSLEKLKKTQNIFAIWHCTLLCLVYMGRNANIQVLISQHTDGEYIASVIKRIGFGVIRGSTTRGGARALKALVDKAKAGYSLAITPDGPRGPRYVVQAGCIYLAKKTGIPLLPVTVGLSNYWKLPSWDEFRIPKPFSRALILYGDPFFVPSQLSEEEMETYRLSLEKTMREMMEKADSMIQQ